MKIVTGCMRSGTSFVCNVLEKLGGDFGSASELVSADEWNIKGYFENRKVNLLNHELLFGRWSSSELWVDHMWPKDRRIKLRKLANLVFAPVATRAGTIEKRTKDNATHIRDLSHDLSGMIVKDPRFSFVLKGWEEYGEVEGVLYCVRHPWEVAHSMSRQTGLPIVLTYLAWRDAVTRFWANPPKEPVYIVEYNNFFKPDLVEAEMKTLFAFLGRDFSSGDAADVLDSVLDKNMYSSVAKNKKMPTYINRLYEDVLARKQQG
ncbi:hypothetical protein [Terasakiella pusilla]|uniref:hypothetical protein n=1 Tax=Terasakiella pusilla TaxID=64973 RepID=UPI003AA8F2F0